MMDSSLSYNPDKQEQVEVDSLKRVASLELSTLLDPQHSCIEEREHLQVYLRIRPFTSAETSNGESQDCVTIELPDTVLLKPPTLSLSARLSSDKSLPQTGQRFQFSQVFGPETTQSELFDGTVKNLVKDVLEGGNSLVFTYGVTNAGKTFTFLGPDTDAGILPRSLDVIFSSIDGQVFPGMSIKPHRCQEFTRLTREKQAEEASFKKNLLRQLKENEKSNASLLNVTNKTLLEGSSMLAANVAAEEKISMELESNTKFSVWVSFCEIYNENIHDLLEVAPSGAPRRTALRLSQDVKGNAFVKDLRWVQVNSAEEAYRVMNLGKKNQTFSSTRLNHLSSRSHSIFSIRVLRIEDTGPLPRVHTVSELCLCDLAGSERCAKTQNKGERLKEAGNINTSLLTLGKCISALRHNQQAKLLQHVPFRESKLTHYLQGFFCGRGKACMMVNINQCASMYDETLSVLRFSAVAQKVVVLSSRPLPLMPQRSTSEVSFIVDDAERTTLRSSRRRRRSSSLNGWESSLEDVQEDEDDEYEEDMSLMEDTLDQTGCDDDDNDDKVVISKKTHQRQVALLKQLQIQLKKERAEGLLMEGRVRQEISTEFSELFSEMQKDYDDRLAREREIMEERAERRMEILKNLFGKMAAPGTSQDAQAMDISVDSIGASLSRPGSGRAGCRADRRGAVEELNKNEHEHNACEAEDEEKTMLVSQLRDKSSEVARLQELVDELQKTDEMNSREGEQLQEALAALEQERKANQEALSALEYQTKGKEEALASLEEERKAREEAVARLEELKRSKEETLACLREERKDKEEALGAERRAKERTAASLAEEEEEKSDVQSALDVERKEIIRLVEEGDALRLQLKDTTDKLKAAEQQVTTETERAGRALTQLRAAQRSEEEEQEKSSLIHTLTQEVERLRQEVATPGGVTDQLRREVSELTRSLAEEKEKQRQTLDQELVQERRRLEEQRLISDQKEEAWKQQTDELNRKLEEEGETLEELRSQLRCQQQASEDEVKRWKGKLEEQTRASEKQLREQEELKTKLSEEKEASSQLVDDLKEKLSQQEKSSELLKAQLEEVKASAASSTSEAEENLRRANSDLQAELTSLRAKAEQAEEAKESGLEAERRMEEVEEMEEASAQREAALRAELLEKEAQLASLQKSLKEAREEREEEEFRAVQEARQREVERRRELLAVAHEAIAHKDEELDQRGQEISRLKENAKQDSEKVKSLNVELQRKEDESSDLREKMADYKKQIQQVQKEISAMREEEKVLRQKLTDAEKTKKQLQCDLATRDRTIQQLKVEQSSNAKSDESLQLYQKACKDLEAKERVMEDMRLALAEQEETQEQMEQVLEEKLDAIQELSSEVEKLKGMLLQQDGGNKTHRLVDSPSDELKAAKKESARAQESLKMFTEKHQGERKKWLEEKLSLIGQAKEAEEKRNQEMRKYAEDRERYNRQQNQLESQLTEKEQTMEKWRKERDALVSALEVQLKKLLSSQAEKDKLIQQLRQDNPPPPPLEVDPTGPSVAELKAALSEKEAEILRLNQELKALADRQKVTQTKSSESPAALAGDPRQTQAINRTSGSRDTRASVCSQSSTGFPSVLDSSEISTENGRTSRFPRPELEISFSPLQPNRVALRRQGEDNAVTVKITRSARKRKSGEMEKEEVEAENRRNTRTKLTPKLTPRKEESSSPAGNHDSQSSIRSRKEGTLQKIGDFLQSSPTLLGSKAKKMMSLVSGRSEMEFSASSSSSSLSLTGKKKKRKLYRPDISSPLDMPAHSIISSEPEEKESHHQVIKRCLRPRK
ncbi:kinesin-like protein KIF20B isoform X2 [Mugil cephalus]|uniref:kinesin-like protein KIF20B isoform X2 n=1 Tax=Mugil cephalus TaxID=48193 RepID=UPI001FB60A33|nr:kinesin-like protein KIF20B isoform X2 [Mugil cephalus]